MVAPLLPLSLLPAATLPASGAEKLVLVQGNVDVLMQLTDAFALLAARVVSVVGPVSYTVLPPDLELQVDTTAGAVTINLLLAASWNGGWPGKGGLPLVIKDVGGNADTNAITINRAGANLVDGLTSYNINTAFGAVRLRPKLGGSGWTFT